MKKNMALLMVVVFLGCSFIGSGAVQAQSSVIAAGDPLPPPISPNKNLAPDTYLQGSELQLSPDASDGERYLPDVAYNSVDKEYLVVWHNTWGGGFRDIYARRVSNAGQVLSWFCVSCGGTHSRLQPAVAFNIQRREYLVVYMYEASANVYEIWGKIIPWNGPGSNAEFLIISWGERSFWTPRVAYNTWANDYLVVWNAFNTTSSFPPGYPNDIGGNIVEFDGYVQTGSPFSWTSAASPHQVDLAYNAYYNEYVMAYVTVHSSATTKNDIDVIHVSAGGALANPPGIIHLAQNVEDENRPAIATDNQDRYIVAWEIEKSSTNHDVWAVPVDWTTNSPIMIYAVNGAEDDTNPDITYNSASNFMMVWQEDLAGTGYAVQGWWVGKSVSHTPDIANYAFWENEDPAIASGGSNFLIAYDGDSSITNRHIFGVLWSPHALFMPVIRK